METKTIKLDKGEYTQLDDIFDKHDVIILSGARGCGKSYPTAKYISSLLENDEDAKFIYMRIMDEELATIHSWASDLELSNLTACLKNKVERGKPGRGDIKLTGYDADTGKSIVERLIGKCISLNNSHLFKSGKYNEYKAIVFEEYTHKDTHPVYEQEYVFNFIENVISIFRDRPKKIILLSNALKTIPLLETTIDELTGELFNNPIKVKIFRKNSSAIKNSYLSYLSGEVYEPDDFKVHIAEFKVFYCNKDFIIRSHRFYQDKFYVQFNKVNRKFNGDMANFPELIKFCRNKSRNNFFYQSDSVEREFQKKYNIIIEAVAKLINDKGSHYLR